MFAMQPSTRTSICAGLMALGALGCGEVSTPSNPIIGRGGNAGRGGAAGAGGDGGTSNSDAGSAGSAGDGGSAGLAQDGGAGSSGSSGEGSGGSSDRPPDCPEPNPIPVPGQSIVIQSLNFNNSEIILRNASDEPQTLTGGRMGWQWCNFPAYWYMFDQDITLEPGETVSVVAIYNTSGPRPFFPGDDAGSANELGIYISSGSFDEPNLIHAFVSWGLGTVGGRESIASMAEVWSFGERITIEPGDAGFIVTGETNRGAGYTSAPERCLVP